uniref:Caudal type homeobox 1a n=1 Tax=Stegastes partitus TaxID=144197 RepID=A0A3B4YYV1_9TELE
MNIRTASRVRAPAPARSPSPPRRGKTRTKDKYRVVYTDHQRMELEKEFQYNRYITMRRKSELSMTLSLSERQVKIWFQNRRAKERKINRKKLQQSQQASTTTPTPPVHGILTSPPLSLSMLSGAVSCTNTSDHLVLWTMAYTQSFSLSSVC